MNIAVCEDTMADRTLLCEYINAYFKERSCAIEIDDFESGKEFLEFFSLKEYQIVCLDIYMPAMTGIEVAREIRKIDSNVGIIFITTSKDHALDSYGVDAMQYLVKPLNYDDLKMVLDKCRDRFAESMRYISVLSNRVPVNVLLRDIIYVEVHTNACILHTMQGPVKTYCTLDEIDNMLGGEPFLRCHRTHIVNMNYITKLSVGDFLLKTGELTPIRKSEKKEITKRYSDYLFSLTRRDL